MKHPSSHPRPSSQRRPKSIQISLKRHSKARKLKGRHPEFGSGSKVRVPDRKQ